MANVSIVGTYSKKVYDAETINGRVKVRFYPELLHAEFSVDGSSWLPGILVDNYLIKGCYSLHNHVYLKDELATITIFVDHDSDTDNTIADCLAKSGIEAEIIRLEEENGKKE